MEMTLKGAAATKDRPYLTRSNSESFNEEATQTELPSAVYSLRLCLKCQAGAGGCCTTHSRSTYNSKGGGEGPAGKQDEKRTPGSA